MKIIHDLFPFFIEEEGRKKNLILKRKKKSTFLKQIINSHQVNAKGPFASNCVIVWKKYFFFFFCNCIKLKSVINHI